MFTINGPTLALPIGTVRSADLRAFVPCEAEPVQTAENRGFGLRSASRRIRIFNAQNELATMLPGKAVVEQRNIRRAYVGITRRRRCYSSSDDRVGHKPAILRQSPGFNFVKVLLKR